ncbi:MAG: hypothetical protein ABSH09_08875 [Bryobacteraceae bacterium]
MARFALTALLLPILSSTASGPRQRPRFTDFQPPVEARGTPPSRYYELVGPLSFGARNPGNPAFHGWLDEIAFYGRALSKKRGQASVIRGLPIVSIQRPVSF